MRKRATVYVTGHSVTERKLAEVAKADGTALALPCDHADDAAVAAAFARVEAEQGQLDILVNNAWGGCARLRNRSANKGVQ